MLGIRRREFITLFGGVVAWPLTARAQQPAVPVIGFLHNAAPEATQYYLPAFHKGLSEVGFVEGRNVGIEFRWARAKRTQLLHGVSCSIPTPLPFRLMCPHLRRRPGHSRSRQSLRPFIAR